ncbi:hypothetical protein PM082_012466 [Marasmius tenuissimus]|nr:hypothetical protein PM082_012466 [Marasmius tenuissimus]
MYANNTTVYLSEDDNYEDLGEILDKWCEGSTAKFNTRKTNIIPLGEERYHLQFSTTRKLNPDSSLIQEKDGAIITDGSSARILGGQIGNKVSQCEPWTGITQKVETKLAAGKKCYPTFEAKHHTVRMYKGGCTQYHTMIADMPKEVEKVVAKSIHTFTWDEALPTLNKAIMTANIFEGGRKFLDILGRNESIALRFYLYKKPGRATWAYLVDRILNEHRLKEAPHDVEAWVDPFLQNWGMIIDRSHQS